MKKGDEDEDQFVVDYQSIEEQFVEPVSEKMIIELLVLQGVKEEFLNLFYDFVVEIQKQAEEKQVKLTFLNEFTTVPVGDIMASQEKVKEEGDEQQEEEGGLVANDEEQDAGSQEVKDDAGLTELLQEISQDKYENLQMTTKLLSELTRDDYIVDYSTESRFGDIEEAIHESKAIVWIDRLSIRKDNNRVCLSDKSIAQVLYGSWYDQKDLEREIDKHGLIIMIGDELSKIVNDLDIAMHEEEKEEGGEGEEGEDEDKKDDEGVTSQYKSNKSGEEGETTQEKTKVITKQNMDFICHQFTNQKDFQMRLLSGEYNCVMKYLKTYPELTSHEEDLRMSFLDEI